MNSQTDLSAKLDATQQMLVQLLESNQHVHPSLWHSLLYMVIYAFVGVFIAIGGYKLFDMIAHGDLSKEIIQNKNVAAAVVGAAIILGVCILVAACIVG